MTVPTADPTQSQWRLQRTPDGEPIDGAHSWVAASNVTLTDAEVKQALKPRGVVRVPDAIVYVLEVHCGACRMPYERAVLTECVVDERLRGGPVGTRKRRNLDVEGEANPA